MKKFLLLTLFVCFSAGVAFSQGISIGLRGGLTLTSGNTTLPVQPDRNLPEVKNESDGQGAGFVFGATARVKLGGLFLQGELNYNRFVLKQKTGTSFDVPVPIIGTANTKLDIRTTSTLDAINIPILVGKSFAGGLVRAYIGPSFLFVSKAEQKSTGTITTSIGGNVLNSTSADATQDLLKSDAGVVEVRPLIIAVEVGAGVSLPMGIEADLRYGIPAITGVYKNRDVKGFLGILSLTVGYRLVKLGL